MVSSEALKLDELLRNASKAVNMDLQHPREALLDDSVRLARSAGMAGVDVTLYIGARMQRIFPIYCGVITESDTAVAMIGAWIRFRTSRESEQTTHHNGKEDPVPARDKTLKKRA